MLSLERTAALGLALVLAVVLAAAGIRLGLGWEWLRPVHRVAASLEALVMLWLVWIAWRRPAAWLALLLTLVLSVAGIVGGQQPPPALSAINLLGGLALAATFAWILGRSRGGETRRAATALLILLLLVVQAALGARLSIVHVYLPALPAHALLAIALAALLGWFGLARVKGPAGRGLFALALLAPVAGFTSLHLEYSAAAALAHAAAAALLLAATGYALGRGA